MAEIVVAHRPDLTVERGNTAAISALGRVS